MFKFSKYLKHLKPVLRAMGRRHLYEISNKVSDAFEELCVRQESNLQNPTAANMEAESIASRRWESLSEIEEEFLRQRAKLHWLRVGDKNNAFFHNSIRARRSKNRINELKISEDEILVDPQAIKTEAVNHFQTFLNHIPDSYDESLFMELPDLINFRCNIADGDRLIRPVSDEEITSTLFGMARNKAPGPDGFTSEFFTTAWAVVKDDFLVAIKSFFQTGFLPKSVNATILALIPKKEDAATIKDYRPISLCNVLYKVISRILAVRLRELLPDMIALNQSAFVPKRLLMENVLLASEVVRDYHRMDISPRCAMKIDISKAFDSVQWAFILEILKVMQVPDQFIHWIRICITTPSFSVQVNGELAGYFTSSRGLRQGCSLSPFLFVICMDVLSKLLDRAGRNRQFSYHPRCKLLGLTHLCFADDLLVFVKGNKRSIEGVVSVLDHFSRLSGLTVNLEKSSLFLGGISEGRRLELCSSFPFVVGALPVRYLGLPLLTKRLTAADYGTLIERVRSKLSSWTTRHLSYAGRLQLIQSVIYGIVNFWQTAFYLPGECLRDLEGLCSAFLWDGPALSTVKAKVSWERITRPKQEGGLGLRKFKDTNTVSCLKLLWRILSRQSTLWVRWVETYLLKEKSIWTLSTINHGTWMFKKILKMRDMAKNLHKVDVRSGRGTSFWYDNWSDLGRLWDLLGPRGVIDFGIRSEASVAEVILSRRRRRHRNDINQEVENVIASTVTRSSHYTDEPDIHLWRQSIDGFASTFDAAKTWKLIRSVSTRVSWANFAWFPQSTPKHSFLFWMVCNDSIQTLDKMRRWNAAISGNCCLCSNSIETRNHLFLECRFSTEVWWKLMRTSLGNGFTTRLWELARLILGERDRTRRFVKLYCLQATTYLIWSERNCRHHGSIPRSVDTLVKIVDRQVRNRLAVLQAEGLKWLKDGLQYWFSIRSSV